MNYVESGILYLRGSGVEMNRKLLGYGCVFNGTGMNGILWMGDK
jgi:hypothetical protein